MMNQSDFGDSKVKFDNDDYIAKSRYIDQTMQDKTFMSQKLNGYGIVWKPFDFLFPAGKLAKLVRVYDVQAPGFPWGEILVKLKLSEGLPVINMIGAKECERAQFYAGIARSAFNCDAVIIDSGIQTGIERYAIRREIKLIGVAPENEIKFPKINPTYIDPMELSNGHTHLFLLNNQENDFVWSQEVWFKMDLAIKIAEGRPKAQKRTDGRPRCKIVNILMGDTPYYIDEIKLAIKNQLPIIVVKGSPICNALIKKYAPKKEEQQKNSDQDQNEQDENQENEQESGFEIDSDLLQIMDKGQGHFYFLDSDDSEDIAQYVHFLLTVTPYEDKSLQKSDLKGQNNQQQQNQSQNKNQQGGAGQKDEDEDEDEDD